MTYLKNKIIFKLLLLVFLTAILPAQAALLDLLQDGQHVLLMRHADAPGYGDPAGYQLGQCPTQRNLGEAGKRQAKLIGDWLVQQGVKEPKLFSSPWCRCLDTASLMNLGSTAIEPILGSFFDDMSLEMQQTKQLAMFVKKALLEFPKKPIILVTHHVNIQGFTGKVVDVGDMVLVRVDMNGRYVSHTIYKSPRF